MNKTTNKTRFKVGDIVRMNQGFNHDLGLWPGVVVELRQGQEENMGILWFMLNSLNTFIVTGSWADDDLSIYDRDDRDDSIDDGNL